MALPVVAPILYSPDIPSEFAAHFPGGVNPSQIIIGEEKTYNYVIAQTGGTAITVDAHPYFEVHVEGITAPTLTVRSRGFTTGGVGGLFDAVVPVTIRISNDDGEVVQNLPFTLPPLALLSSPEQPLVAPPNIVSADLIQLAANVAVNYTIDSDPSGSTIDYDISNLPAGLSVANDLNRRIVGIPPTTPATYFIILEARNSDANGGLGFRRYVVLRVAGGGTLTTGTGGTSGDGSGTGGRITPGSGGGGINTDYLHYDGDFFTASQVGQPIFEAPIPTDPKQYVYHVPYWQLRKAYADLALGTAGPYGGYYAGTDSFRDEGGGIVSFWRTYAVVPDSRTEFESYVYSWQIAEWGGENGSRITEVPLTLNSRLQFDYYVTDTPKTDIALGYAPRALMVFETLYLLHYQTATVQVPGSEIRAIDDTYHVWMGNIYERVQRWITVPSNFLQI